MASLFKRKRGEVEDGNTPRNDKQSEAEGEKLPYPKSVFFIIGNELCERFSYYGMKSILSLYLKTKLKYSEDKATVIYHGFSTACYFTPIFGAMISDMFLGKFRTIVYISMLYILGHILKTLAAIPTTYLTVAPIEMTMVGLALIALGTGGIKPCVAAFGGDQFRLPQQERQLQTYFSIFYFAINSGSLISTFVTPVLKADVKCFGQDTCYSLAFGVPAILMAIATVIIIIGYPMYIHSPPQGNILPTVFGSIWYAAKKKVFGKKVAGHWMDVAKKRYDPQLIEDIKRLLKVLLIFIPLPIFWALFDQTGSRWTFQANRMSGVLTDSYTMKPDQMQVANPVLVLILIPLFDRLIYPFFARFGFLVKPLQRMSVGIFFTSVSFFISGILELQMQKTYAQVPSHGVAHLNVMNSLPCNVSVKLLDSEGFLVGAMELEGKTSLVLNSLSNGSYTANLAVQKHCLPDFMTERETTVEFECEDEEVKPLLVSLSSGALAATPLPSPDEPEKDDNAKAKLRIIMEVSHDLSSAVDGGEEAPVVKLAKKDDGHVTHNVSFEGEKMFMQSNYTKMEIGIYRVDLEGVDLGVVDVKQGGVYNLLISKNAATNILGVQEFVLTQPNSIHMLWLVPQYVVITIGEIMFSITGLEFSYSQAPASMKAVVQAAWLLTVAFGNIIVIIVAEAKSFDQVGEFFFFGCLMFIDLILFIFLAWRYTPRNENDETEDKAEDENSVVPSKNGCENFSYGEGDD